MKIGTFEVGRIGLGTNRLRNTPRDVAFVRAAVEAGVRMIDTARLYTDGDSERAIGAARSPAVPDCVVATKGGYGGAGQGRPAVLRAQIEESLRSLGAERIALYYLHRVDPETPIEESLAAIKEYVDRGTILHVGISDVTIGQIERARRVLPVAAVQNRYNLGDRSNDAVIEYCEVQGIAFVPFYPLHAAEGAELERVAKRHGATPRQIALAWLLRRSPVMLPIPGTLSIEHVKQNLAAADIELTTAEYQALR